MKRDRLLLRRKELKVLVKSLRRQVRKDAAKQPELIAAQVELESVSAEIVAHDTREASRPYGSRRTLWIVGLSLVVAIFSLMVPYMPTQTRLRFGTVIVSSSRYIIDEETSRKAEIRVPLTLDSGDRVQIHRVRAIISDDLTRREFDYRWDDAANVSGRLNDPSALVVEDGTATSTVLHTSLEGYLAEPAGSFIILFDELTGPRGSRISDESVPYLDKGDTRYFVGTAQIGHDAIQITNIDGTVIAPFFLRLASQTKARCVIQAISGERVVATKDITHELKSWAEREVQYWNRRQAATTAKTKASERRNE